MFRLVLGAHLVCAFGATALFWVPIFAGKGGPLHIRAGRLYARLIYLTALSGAPLAVLLYTGAHDEASRRTAAFLAYLLIILVMPVVHGVRVVRTRGGRAWGAPAWHAALALAAIAGGVLLAAAAIVWREWPYLLVSPIGPVLGVRALKFVPGSNFPVRAAGQPRTGKFEPGTNSWREEHIIAMVMSGIAVHTAALVFGLNRTLHLTLTGASAYVPWVLPTAVGLPLLILRVKRERAGR